ncbi:MAG TPA: Panacea domain-containing protein [Flavobacteriaceae bacterium]|nr:Panacea domain-containing protein [Flavobacteriaceae bacterium]
MGYTKSEIERIGNTIIYLREKINEPISKTKAIKLLYFLEEFSIKKYGRPFLNLEWEVWHLGPVSEDLFAEINEPFMLNEHIKQSYLNGLDGCFIETKHAFNDDEFSDADISLMDILIENIGHLNANQLIKLAHRKHTLWYKIANENNLLESFNNKTKTTTDFKINLSELLTEDKLEIYNAYIESKEISKLYAI